jgi:hypothetical protein
VIDELELLIKYPVGMEITFTNNDQTGHSTGPVNGAPFATEDAQVYVPVYMKQRDQTVYVNEHNIVEAE